MIEEVVIKQISDQNARIAEIYKHKIWANNKSAVLKLKNRNFESLMTDQDFIQFAKKSSQFFKNSSYVFTENSPNLVPLSLLTKIFGTDF